MTWENNTTKSKQKTKLGRAKGMTPNFVSVSKLYGAAGGRLAGGFGKQDLVPLAKEVELAMTSTNKGMVLCLHPEQCNLCCDVVPAFFARNKTNEYYIGN